MYSDSEDEVFFGPLTMREIKIEFGVIDQKNMSTSKNNEQRKMESNRNSIIEISSEENSFADLNDKENTNPIPSFKNISISNNFESAVKETKLEDTFKSKFNECSNSTVSTNSDDTKSISSSFLDKLVACISEGNENLFENIHIAGKRNVQASPCLSRIEEIQSFNTNNSNTSNKNNDTYDLIIDLSNSKSENETQHEGVLQNVEVKVGSEELKRCISSIQIDDEFSEKLYDCISSIHNEEFSENYESCISPVNNGEIFQEKCISPINKDEIVQEKFIPPINNDEIVDEKCVSTINNDEIVQEKCFSSINNDEVVQEKCISSINNDESVQAKCISSTNNHEIVQEKCISPINNDEVVSEKIISPFKNDEKNNLPIKQVIFEINTKIDVENSYHDAVVAVDIDNKFDYLEVNEIENQHYKDDFEDIDSNYSSKIEDINEIEISKILDEDESSKEINNTFSECTLNSTNENGKKIDEILEFNQKNDEVQRDEHENVKKNYAGYTELKMYNRIETVDKIENIFFENRPESDLEIEKSIQSNLEEPEDYPRHYNIETNDTLDRFLENNKMENENGSLLNESNTSSLGCEEFNSSIEEPNRFPLNNRKFITNSIEHVHPNMNDNWKQTHESVTRIEHVHSKPYHQDDIDSHREQVEKLEKVQFSTSSIEHVHSKSNKSKRQNMNDNWKQTLESVSRIEHVHSKPYHQNYIDSHREQVGSPIEKLEKVQFSTSPIEHVHSKSHNSLIGESKEVQSMTKNFSKSFIEHKNQQKLRELEEVQTLNRSSIDHIHRQSHRQTEIIDTNWKQALALSNDTLIAEQSMLPTSVTLLEKTNIDSPENNKVFKPIPTIIEKSEQSIDVTCSENESMLSESHHSLNESYSTACEDSGAECNNTLDMIDRLLKMEAASNVQSAEKSKQVEHVSPRKPKLDPPTNSNIRSLSKLRTPKAVVKPLENINSKINSPLKTTPKKPVSNTPSRFGLQKVNGKIQTTQSKISPLVKNVLPPRKGFVIKTPSSATKNVQTKLTGVNSPKMISPIIKCSKELISKSNKTVPTKLNSPLLKNTKTPSSTTKTALVDSPITAEINELTESFDHGKTENSFVQLRSTLRRQLSDLYIEPSSTEKRVTPKPKMGSNVEAKKNVFKTPTISRVLKSTEKSKMPKNIMSPVDFYINKAPQSPLVVKCDYSKRQTKFYDKEKLKNGETNEVETIGNPLPFCAYKSASNVKLFEDKTTEVPKSVRKFFPTVQYVIKHESRIKTEERKSPRVRQQAMMNNDSLNALDNSLSIFNASSSANDVSVRVKKSALRTPK